MSIRVPQSSTRRALLIGATAPDLRGVERDVELMAEALARHDFDVRRVVPATRVTTLRAIEDLIAQTEPGDAVVLHYSGHGARVMAADKTAIGEQSYYRFLLMSDFQESTDSDFRGVANIELSLLLDRLTDRTPNVTVIMDCCYAGRVFRKGEHEDEAIVWQDISSDVPTRFHEVRGRWLRAAQRHYERLRAGEADNEEPVDAQSRDSEANPHAVVLLASAAGGRAYEAKCGDGYAGFLTMTLSRLLGEYDPRYTTWREIGRVLRMTPRRTDQRVDVEGPYRRLLFQLDEREQLGAVELDLSDGRILLAGGRLLDLAVDDLYEIVELSPRGKERVLGRVQIDAVASSHATVTTELRADQLSGSCRARRIHTDKPRAIVELEGFEGQVAQRELIEARLRASGILEVVAAGAGTGGLPVAARVRLGEGRIQLTAGSRSFDKARIFSLATQPNQARQIADYLSEGAHLLARQARLSSLRDDDAGTLEGGWTLDCGRVEAERLATLFDRDGADVAPARVRVGDPITVRFATDGARRYLSAFLLHPHGAIEHLTRAQAGGVEVDAEAPEYLLGQRTTGPLRGVEIREVPRTVETSAPAFELALVAFVTDKPVDLRSWAQRGINRFNPSDALGRASVTRDFKAPPPRVVPAAYEIVTYRLHLEQPERKP